MAQAKRRPPATFPRRGTQGEVPQSRFFSLTPAPQAGAASATPVIPIIHGQWIGQKTQWQVKPGFFTFVPAPQAAAPASISIPFIRGQVIERRPGTSTTVAPGFQRFPYFDQTLQPGVGRFYYDNTALAATSAVRDPNWTEDKRSVANQLRVLLAGATGDNGFSYEAAAAAANGNFTLHAMYRYDIAAGLLITGNMRGELVGGRGVGGNQVSPAIAVNIRNAADVIVARLVQYFPSPFNGYADALPGTVFPTPPSTPIIDAGYITQVGDKLVVEIGIGWLNVASTAGPIPGGRRANSDWNPGDSGLAGAEPQVKNPWIEFETPLAPAGPGRPFTAFEITKSPRPMALRPAMPQFYRLVPFQSAAVTVMFVPFRSTRLPKQMSRESWRSRSTGFLPFQSAAPGIPARPLPGFVGRKVWGRQWKTLR